jgi:hypothetical protein
MLNTLLLESQPSEASAGQFFRGQARNSRPVGGLKVFWVSYTFVGEGAICPDICLEIAGVLQFRQDQMVLRLWGDICPPFYLEIAGVP